MDPRAERRREIAVAKQAQGRERSRRQREVAAERRARVREAWQARHDEAQRRQRASIHRATRGREIALVDLIDRLLDGGVVIHGDITLAVADVDLLYVGLRAMVASVETIEEKLGVSLSARSASLERTSLDKSPVDRTALGSSALDKTALDKSALDTDALDSDAF